MRPTRAPSGDWLIPSGSQGGAVVHRVSRHGGVWVCGETCKATAFHWHGAFLAGIERAEELAEAEDEPPPPPIGMRLAAARRALIESY